MQLCRQTYNKIPPSTTPPPQKKKVKVTGILKQWNCMPFVLFSPSKLVWACMTTCDINQPSEKAINTPSASTPISTVSRTYIIFNPLWFYPLDTTSGSTDKTKFGGDGGFFHACKDLEGWFDASFPIHTIFFLNGDQLVHTSSTL